MAITLVSQYFGFGTSTNIATVSGVTTSDGDLLAVCGYWFDPSGTVTGITSVDDGGTNPYSWSTVTSNGVPPASWVTDGTSNTGTFVAYSLATNGLTGATVTVTCPAAVSYCEFIISEWSSAGLTDSGASGSGTGTATTPGGLALAGTGELVIGALDRGAGTITMPAGFTSFAGTPNPGQEIYQVAAAAGTVPVSWGISTSTTWTTALMSFASSGLSGPNYATAASGLAGGAGSWAGTANADGAPDGTYATWTAP